MPPEDLDIHTILERQGLGLNIPALELQVYLDINTLDQRDNIPEQVDYQALEQVNTIQEELEQEALVLVLAMGVLVCKVLAAQVNMEDSFQLVGWEQELEVSVNILVLVLPEDLDIRTTLEHRDSNRVLNIRAQAEFPAQEQVNTIQEELD